jgi:hypothetical protein
MGEIFINHNDADDDLKMIIIYGDDNDDNRWMIIDYDER